MFGTFSVIRFSQFTAILFFLSVGLVVHSGCQCFLPKPKSTPPPLPPEVQRQKIDETDKYEAFRPIILEQFTPPITSPISVQELPKAEPSSDVTAQSKIDVLSKRISELEMQLEEARNTTPPVNLIDLPVPENSSAIEQLEVRSVRSLPIVNRRGVNVYADESQLVRFEVADETLFLPNSWQLTAEGEETLRVIAAEIKAFDSKSILDIEGHTDSLMGDPNNPMQKHEISSAKTKVIMDFFVNSLSWDTSRIGTSSFGRNRPIADNGTPEGRSRNNRIEIVLRNGIE